MIVQNFRAKPGTKMAGHPEPSLEELLWTAAAARLILPAAVHVQCPPNLSYGDFPRLLDAGIDDWGGISPVTVDHVNPEAPWPEIERLGEATEAAGLSLAPRLAIYPSSSPGGGSIPPSCRESCMRPTARAWRGTTAGLPARTRRFRSSRATRFPSTRATSSARRRSSGSSPPAGRSFTAVLAAADRLRREVNGDTVTYVVTRNINYTNVCYFRCGFCAFSKGRLAANLRGKPYLVPLDETVRRAREAWDRGAVEICLQGGIHPGFTGETYLEICRALKAELPDLHIHAFSALEVWQGAATLGLGLEEYLGALRDAGLASLPGTAAEILDDEVRRVICPDKVTTAQWLRVHDTAHRVGLRSTTTVMFGHVDGPRNWARHLIELREQQRRTGGFTEFVPLPFVHMEAPMYLKGLARPGPTFREALLMHAVGRLALHPWITNVQASWVKLGVEGAQAVLRAGANDLGGTLMNESISRAAGADHGQEFPPEAMEEAIRAIGRTPSQRTTLYGEPPSTASPRPSARRRSRSPEPAGERGPPQAAAGARPSRPGRLWVNRRHAARREQASSPISG